MASSSVFPSGSEYGCLCSRACFQRGYEINVVMKSSAGFRVMRPSLRFLLKCVAMVTVAAITIALGLWRFHWLEPSHAHSESRGSEERRPPEKLSVSLRAQTRQ